MNQMVVVGSLLATLGAMAGGGCGDALTAPRLVTRAAPVVPPQQLGFDHANVPLALLHGDLRQRLTRLGPTGFAYVPGTEDFDIHGLGADADGSPLFTVVNDAPGSALYRLEPDDTFVQLGGRIGSASAVEPFQSLSGTRFVSTVDGGRSLPAGATTWGFAQTVSQVARGLDGTVFGMTTAGAVRLAGDRDDATVLLPCAAFPVPCARVTFAGVDREERLYFRADAAGAQRDLLVLEPGADALAVVTIAGAHALGAVRVAPDLVVVEVLAPDEGGAGESFLYVRRVGAARFERVDQTARLVLDHPLLAVDRAGTVYVSDHDWLGTIELSAAGAE